MLLDFQKAVVPEDIRKITDRYLGDLVMVELPPFMEWPASTALPAVGVYGYVPVEQMAHALFPDPSPEADPHAIQG